jgi:hypothetical protein
VAAEVLTKKHRDGPLVEVIYQKDGVDMNSLLVYAMGFGHFLVTSFLAAVVLLLAAPGLRAYPARVFFVFLVGVFASVAVHLSYPIWFHHPWPVHLVQAGYTASSWLLAGVVLGLVIRPRRPETRLTGLSNQGPHVEASRFSEAMKQR